MTSADWAQDLQVKIRAAGEELAKRTWEEMPGKKAGKWDTQPPSIRNPLVDQFTTYVASRVATHVLSPAATQHGDPEWGPRRFPSKTVEVDEIPAAVLSVAAMMDEVKTASAADGKLEEAASALANLAGAMLPRMVDDMVDEAKNSTAGTASAPSGGCLIAMVGSVAAAAWFVAGLSRVRRHID